MDENKKIWAYPLLGFLITFLLLSISLPIIFPGELITENFYLPFF
jgi:hypothetical protein